MILTGAILAAALVVARPGDEVVPFGSHDPQGTWKLIWADEFEGNRLDANKWHAEDACVRNNQELQYYTPESLSLAGGVLTIRAERRTMKGREYTGGLIDTRGLFSMAYGRFECRAKLPRGQGMWPAIWMLPERGDWPPEIDVMENLGQEPQRIHTTLHWGDMWPANQKTSAHFDGPDYSQGFHVFAVEWTPQRLEWLIDGQPVFHTDRNVPQEPFYLIINLAVGGNWGGNPDGATRFPQELSIDWVRAFQRGVEGTMILRASARGGTALPEPRRWSFKAADAVQLRAEPEIGYEFKGWSGDASGSENPLRLQMDADRNVVALFAPVPDGPRLLSLNRPVRASSHEGSGMEPELAVDGSAWTRWSANGAEREWIEVDLGEERSIEGVKLVWTENFATAYSIEVSRDRSEWSGVYRESSGHGHTERITGLKARGRYVRLNATARSRQYGYSLFTFEVYGR